MKRERIVEFVGGSEEDIAYLRLSLRKATHQLTDKWRLRREEDSHVDLLIIEDLVDVAMLPLTAANEGWQRRVRLIDPAFGAAGMESAPWPLALETMTRLFNLSSVSVDVPPAVAAPVIQQNVYDDLFEPSESSRWHGGGDFQIPTLDFNDEWSPPPRAPETGLTLEAEQLFRRDPRPAHKDVLAALRLDDFVDVEATDGKTVGGASRKDRRDAVGLHDEMAHAMSVEEANVRHPLAAYLTGRMLPGPSRIEDFGVALTLDPRNRLYYAKGALCIFEESCRRTLRRGDWRSLTSREFDEIKTQLSPRPMAQLHWLCVYLDEHAAAANELDPSTRYRLIQSIDLTSDYPRAARIAQALEQRCTLSAATAAAGATPAEAQRVAHAFDVMGFLIPD